MSKTFDIVQAFRANLSIVSDKEREKILFFVVVDGGPTRVEFAAELHDFLHEDLAKLYPTLKSYVKITLLEAADHILGMLIGKCWQLMNGYESKYLKPLGDCATLVQRKLMSFIQSMCISGKRLH
ncbi:hypothetical protein POM88_041859 [Heracleum sosnowskyi]|uniref:NADH:ubiquinone reductase (non-electrogenic) n=1 Tax=Heracleum sosnowskyi TaxID=360622 RepID=A0AAD8HHH6_9APIA|nr:hypothetical protein POM88_041859 [Heracleum sosnowskyi]